MQDRRPSFSSTSAAVSDRIGGSCLAQVYGRTGDVPPDLDDPARLASFFAAIRALRDAGLLLAYHDRSDGGLAVTLLEMAFAGRAAIEVDLGAVGRPAAALFSEELGAVLQVRDADLGRTEAELARHGLAAFARRIGAARPGGRVRIAAAGRVLVDEDRRALHAALVRDHVANAEAARRAGLRRRGTRCAP